jgi:hypothetical protein
MFMKMLIDYFLLYTSSYICADGVNLLGENRNITNKKTQTLSDASKDIQI